MSNAERTEFAAYANGADRLPQALYDIGTNEVAPDWANRLARGVGQALINNSDAIAVFTQVQGNRESSLHFKPMPSPLLEHLPQEPLSKIVCVCA